MKRASKTKVLCIIVICLFGCVNERKEYINIEISKDISLEESDLYLEKDQYLPIGTIIKHKESEEKIMITDTGIVLYKQGVNIQYDYAGISYPLGVIDFEHFIAFNEKGIEKIYQLGYINKEFLKFADLLLDELDFKNETGFQDLLSEEISQEWAMEFYDSGLLFPLGTVFEIQGDYMIIIGYCMKEEGKEEIYDYLVTFFPYGRLNSELRVINQEEIPRDSIRFLGYIDEDYLDFFLTDDNR